MGGGRIPSGLQPGHGPEQVSPGPSEQLTVPLRPHHLQVRELCARLDHSHGLLKRALSSFNGWKAVASSPWCAEGD